MLDWTLVYRPGYVVSFQVTSVMVRSARQIRLRNVANQQVLFKVELVISCILRQILVLAIIIVIIIYIRDLKRFSECRRWAIGLRCIMHKRIIIQAFLYFSPVAYYIGWHVSL